jgi:hypothetical protein
MIVVAALFITGAGALSALHYDGGVRPAGATADIAIRDSASWYAAPILASRADDPSAVYLVAPAMPHGAEFAGVRIDTRTNEQTPASITLAPQSPFRVFDSATGVRARVRGIRFDRPAFHLFTSPEDTGPGIHRVDSATGRLEVLSGGHLLFTSRVFNSSSIAEVLSLVSADRGGRWLAALTRGDQGWRLFLFERRAASLRAAKLLEEL